MITEQNSLGITRYIRSSELIARNTDAARTYYHYVSDEIGSTTHIVDEDGIVLNRYEYDAWGRYEYDAWGNTNLCEEKVPNRFKFTGQQLDPVTQQYYLRARFYNPVIARFTQEDTYRGDGLNLYAYCQNNPVFYTDPSGNVCPEGTKDPLLHAPVPSPNQLQSTALVPYDPEFAAKQNTLYGNRSNITRTNRTIDTSAPVSNSEINQPVKPSAQTPTIYNRLGDTKTESLTSFNSQLALPGPGQTSASLRRSTAEQKLADAARGASNKVTDPLTGVEVGRFVGDNRCNVLIEPTGGKTVSAGKNGVDTHTLYPNGSNYQRYNPVGHRNNPTPHGHGHLIGTGPSRKGQGESIDIFGKVVPFNSADAHWPIH